MDEQEPLRGFTVGVTAERKAEEIAAVFRRRGAEVRLGAALRTVPLPEDGELAAATDAVLAAPVDRVVAITGVGFRGWVEAAAQRGVGDRLLAHLRSAEVLARGAKARGAVRGAGLTEGWSADSEESAEVLDHLLTDGVAGQRIAVQIHGEPMRGFRDALTAAGAEVVPVPVYRWTDPADLAPLDAVIDAAIAGSVHALPFTSAAASANVLGRADRTGRGEELRRAVRDRVLVACVGPVTAAPWADEGLPHLVPPRSRTAALVQLVVDELPARYPLQR
ncbi:uroporphyrinogen-III synthase [Saccharopolyspora cebuensis]|uniref:Uroporphyrinogen-III synthase n=1 Tax=Saccharopolyspora cebuensis TaxID=418759 RepID=A0ABV4CR93_9PSEU